MSKKVTIEIQDILDIKTNVDAINKLNLDEVEFTYKGETVDISKSLLGEWGFIGLNNMDFITTGFYKGKEVKGDV